MKKNIDLSELLARAEQERAPAWDALWNHRSIDRIAVAVTPSQKRIARTKERYAVALADPALPPPADSRWPDALGDALATILASLELPGDYLPLIVIPGWLHGQSQGITDVFGAKVELQADGNFFVHPLSPDPDQVDEIAPRSPRESQYWRAVECIRYIRQLLPGAALTINNPVITGPIDTANYILGPTTILEWVYTNPATVHRLLDKITAAIIEVLKGVRAAAGERLTGFVCTRGGPRICSEVRSIISLETYLEFEAPYLHRIGEQTGAYGVHSCGNWERTIPSALADRNIRIMNGQSKENDVAELCRLADGKITISVISSSNLHERFLWQKREDFLKYILETVPPDQPFETSITEEELPFWLDCCRKVRGKSPDLPGPVLSEDDNLLKA